MASLPSACQTWSLSAAFRCRPRDGDGTLDPGRAIALGWPLWLIDLERSDHFRTYSQEETDGLISVSSTPALSDLG